MLTITENGDLKYTRGDTFELEVLPETEFNEGAQLRFVIATDEYNDLIIQTFELSDGKFIVTLSANDRNKLEIGSVYIYKLTTLTPEGKIITQQSGELIVEWGV